MGQKIDFPRTRRKQLAKRGAGVLSECNDTSRLYRRHFFHEIPLDHPESGLGQVVIGLVPAILHVADSRNVGDIEAPEKGLHAHGFDDLGKELGGRLGISSINARQPSGQGLEVGEGHARQSRAKAPRIEAADHLAGQLVAVVAAPEGFHDLRVLQIIAQDADAFAAQCFEEGMVSQVASLHLLDQAVHAVTSADEVIKPAGISSHLTRGMTRIELCAKNGMVCLLPGSGRNRRLTPQCDIMCRTHEAGFLRGHFNLS